MRVIVGLFLILAQSTAWTAEFKPKYGPMASPRAIPLSQEHAYFQSKEHRAPDFWALIGFYVPQFNGAACSAASVAMVLNAARAAMIKTAQKSADDKVILQTEMLDRVTAENWKALLSPLGSPLGSGGGRGTTLDRLGRVTKAAFKAYGFAAVKTRVVHAQNTPAAKASLIAALRENEKSARDFILINFDQRAFTDDAEVGHVSPVAAFDEARERVLVLDPDREYYEPYWVSVQTLLEGMATLDSGAKMNRGYVVVQVAE